MKISIQQIQKAQDIFNQSPLNSSLRKSLLLKEQAGRFMCSPQQNQLSRLQSNEKIQV